MTARWRSCTVPIGGRNFSRPMAISTWTRIRKRIHTAAARMTKNPNEPQQRYGGRWLTTEFEPGDVLMFGMFTLHCSLDNESPENRIRLSTDTRYQLASEPADERWIGHDPFGHGMM